MKPRKQLGLVRRSALWVGAFALLPYYHASAAWEIVPDLELALEARDNARLNAGSALLPDDDDGSTRMLFNGHFTMANVGPRGDLFIEPRIRTDAYADSEDAELESDDLFLDMRGERRWRTATAGLRSYFSKESILYSEVLEAEPVDPDFDDPVAVDTGRLVRFDQDRDRVTLSPYVDVNISERSSLLFEARYLDIGYSGAAVSGRTDFNDTMFATGIVRQIDDRNRATAKLIVSNFEASANDNDTDTIGVEGSFSRVISDVWTFMLTTGLRRSDITFRDAQLAFVEDVDTNFALNLGFRKRSERSTLNLDVRRLIDPNSSGFLEQRDEFRVSVRRQMSPTLTGGLAFRAIDTNVLGDAATYASRDYARIDMYLEWALTQAWSVGVNYDSIYQKFEDDTRDANSNSVSVSLGYRGLSRRD
jgi:hypothetical protein